MRSGAPGMPEPEATHRYQHTETGANARPTQAVGIGSYPVNAADCPVVAGPDHPQVRVVGADFPSLDRHHDQRRRHANGKADYIRALGGELKVIADFGDSWRRVA